VTYTQEWEDMKAVFARINEGSRLLIETTALYDHHVINREAYEADVRKASQLLGGVHINMRP